MIDLLLAVIFILGIIAMVRICWVAITVGLKVLLAIPVFLILFFGLGFINAWLPVVIAIIFILLFNKNAKENGHHWI